MWGGGGGQRGPGVGGMNLREVDIYRLNTYIRRALGAGWGVGVLLNSTGGRSRSWVEGSPGASRKLLSEERWAALSRSPAQNMLCGPRHPLCSLGLSFFNCCVKGWGECPSVAG